VVANRTEIEQVVMNVVLNASEALERSGVVRLRTQRVVLRDRDLAAMTHAEDAVPGIFVGVDICDAGVGMTGETRERIFEPFFTTKVAGRGLGLAAVLGIVNRHRGAIDVESRPGRGTRMSIYLPATTEEAADQPIMPALVAPVGRCCLHGTALVVDDERGVRWMALTILSRAGMRVREAADGRQAIDACKEYGSAIDVILLDLNMPGPSTSEVMHGVRRFAPAARIILSSGYPADGTTLPAGAAAFLQKPYTPGALAETVRLSL
jgi:CheY-like chemotaxis protein